MKVTPEEVVLDVLRARKGELVNEHDLSRVAVVKGVGGIIKSLRDQGHQVEGSLDMRGGYSVISYRLVKEAE